MPRMIELVMYEQLTLHRTRIAVTRWVNLEIISWKGNMHVKSVKLAILKKVQGVPYHWAHFVFVIFSGSRAHTEELYIAIG